MLLAKLKKAPLMKLIYELYVQWLLFLGWKLYDPTAPTREEVLAHGTLDATRRGLARFLRNAAYRIRSECYGGYEECCRDLAQLIGLRVQLERALLTYDILVSSTLFRLSNPVDILQESDPRVRKRVTQYLTLISLNFQWSNDSCEALELRAKDQADWLQPFQKCHTDPFKGLLEPKRPTKTLHGSELQIISLVRALLELSGGREDCRQNRLDQEYSISDNLVGVSGTNWFGDFNPKEMYKALSTSKVFIDDVDIGTLDLVGWSTQMMDFLPIGFPEGHLVRDRERRA